MYVPNIMIYVVLLQFQRRFSGNHSIDKVLLGFYFEPVKNLISIICYPVSSGQCSSPKQYFLLCLELKISDRSQYRPESFVIF